MKYIKIYEDLNKIYKKGDYILVNIKKIKKKYLDPKRFTDDFAKIIDVRFNDIPYEIQFLNKTKIRLKEKLIIRKATPEEVEIKLLSIKYNII